MLVMVLALAGRVARGDPRRAVPDYDGRGNRDVDGDSWLLWIPRVVLSPLYVVNEYVLRRPLGALVRHAERERWAETVAGLFTFGEDDRNLIVPTVLYDFGLLPCVGFYYAGDGVFSDRNALRLHAATWGKRWINATAVDRYTVDRSTRVQARLEFRRAEDNLFFGLGPDTVSDARSRYGLERSEGSVAIRRALPIASRLDAELGAHRIGFVEGECCGDPALDTRIARGELAPPPGYRMPYTAAFAELRLTLDQRRPRPAPGGGSYGDVHVRPDLELGGGRAWIQYGGVLGAALDLTGHRRTLRAQLALDFVDAITADPIPFTEYPVAGGGLMPGFVAGWMTGRSVGALQLAYAWPLWLWVDGQMRLSVGNAFGEHLDGLEPRALRLSWDFGLTTATARDQGFEFLVGLGSEPLGRGAGITSVRVALGTRHGF